GLWVSPLPVLAITLTTLVVNLRYLVMGATLRPWFERLSRFKTYGMVYFLSDENWALTMREFAAERRDAAFMLGSGILLTLCWFSFSVLGYFIGGAVSNPAQWGLDFAFVAVFLALLAGMWKGKADLLPWGAAAVVAIAAAHWLPGEWYILLGGLVGSLVGALRHGK
ncbi:MAG TPA: AzlC family ABC transporter permease, partial [Ktedonobacterales bacterium]